jgi:hypothetical protein
MDEDVRRDMAEIRDNTRRLVELLERLVETRPRRFAPKHESFTTEDDLADLRERIAASRANRKR